jgi:hypothetical protein
MQMTDLGACIVALYLCVPEERQRAAGETRSSLRRMGAQLYDILRAYVRARPEFRFHAWDAAASNKGDIAIRESIKEQLRHALAPRPVSFLEFEWGSLDAKAVEAINQRACLFVIAGSGYFFPVDGVMPGRIIQDSVSIPAIEVPKVAYAVGWNTLMGEDKPLDDGSLATLKAIAMRLDKFSVRDTQTQTRILTATGIEPRVTIDPVLFYRGDALPSPAVRQRRKIGINIACHGSWSAANVKRDIGKIAETLKMIETRYDAELHFISHSPADRIVWWLLRARGVHMRFRRTEVSRMPGIYREMDALFGQMMHSTIFAMGAGVPVVAIGYDVKLYGFFEMMGMSEFLVDLSDWKPSEVVGLLDRAMNEGEVIRQALARRQQALMAGNLAFLAEVADLCGT